MSDHVFDPDRFGLPEAPELVRRLPDEAATLAFGEEVAAAARPGHTIGLAGNLGAGKTTFTQGFCRRLSDGEATSPTYTLLNIYRGEIDVFHFDLYRLENVGDLEGIGYWDYVESGSGVAVVEWIDQIPEAWTGQGAVIHLDYDGAGRKASVWAGEGFDIEELR